MNRHIRGLDVNGAQVCHFEEIASGDWRGVDIDRRLGIGIYTWETMITRLADLIGDGNVTMMRISDPAAEVNIDGSRNTWIEHKYLDPSRYLLMLIPERLSS